MFDFSNPQDGLTELQVEIKKFRAVDWQSAEDVRVQNLLRQLKSIAEYPVCSEQLILFLDTINQLIELKHSKVKIHSYEEKKMINDGDRVKEETNNFNVSFIDLSSISAEVVILCIIEMLDQENQHALLTEFKKISGLYTTDVIERAARYFGDEGEFADKDADASAILDADMQSPMNEDTCAVALEKQTAFKISDFSVKLRQYVGEHIQCLSFPVIRDLTKQIASAKNPEVDDPTQIHPETSGRELIVPIGQTGAAKTSVVRWLAGSEFNAEGPASSRGSRRFKEVTKSLQLEGIGNRFKIGSGQSVTADFDTLPNVVVKEPVKKSMFSWGASSEKDTDSADLSSSLLLCDAPGFGDTKQANGPIFKIANSLYLTTPLMSSKSVRFLVVLKASEFMGERFSEFNTLLKTISRLFKDDDLIESLPAFTYVITGDQGVHLESRIKGDLNSIEEQLGSAGLTEVEVALFAHMKKTLLANTRRLPLIRPGCTKTLAREELMSILRASESIKSPGQSLKVFVENDEEKEIKKQIKIHQGVIQGVITHISASEITLDKDVIKGQIALAVKKFEDLVFIYETFGFGMTAIEEVVRHFHSLQDSLITQLKALLYPQLKNRAPTKQENMLAQQILKSCENLDLLMSAFCQSHDVRSNSAIALQLIKQDAGVDFSKLDRARFYASNRPKRNVQIAEDKITQSRKALVDDLEKLLVPLDVRDRSLQNYLNATREIIKHEIPNTSNVGVASNPDDEMRVLDKDAQNVIISDASEERFIDLIASLKQIQMLAATLTSQVDTFKVIIDQESERVVIEKFEGMVAEFAGYAEALSQANAGVVLLDLIECISALKDAMCIEEQPPVDRIKAKKKALETQLSTIQSDLDGVDSVDDRAAAWNQFSRELLARLQKYVVVDVKDSGEASADASSKGSTSIDETHSGKVNEGAFKARLAAEIEAIEKTLSDESGSLDVNKMNIATHLKLFLKSTASLDLLAKSGLAQSDYELIKAHFSEHVVPTGRFQAEFDAEVSDLNKEISAVSSKVDGLDINLEHASKAVIEELLSNEGLKTNSEQAQEKLMQITKAHLLSKIEQAQALIDLPDLNEENTKELVWLFEIFRLVLSHNSFKVIDLSRNLHQIGEALKEKTKKSLDALTSKTTEFTSTDSFKPTELSGSLEQALFFLSLKSPARKEMISEWESAREKISIYISKFVEQYKTILTGDDLNTRMDVYEKIANYLKSLETTQWTENLDMRENPSKALRTVLAGQISKKCRELQSFNLTLARHADIKKAAAVYRELQAMIAADGIYEIISDDQSLNIEAAIQAFSLNVCNALGTQVGKADELANPEFLQNKTELPVDFFIDTATYLDALQAEKIDHEEIKSVLGDCAKALEALTRKLISGKLTLDTTTQVSALAEFTDKDLNAQDNPGEYQAQVARFVSLAAAATELSIFKTEQKYIPQAAALLLESLKEKIANLYATYVEAMSAELKRLTEAASKEGANEEAVDITGRLIANCKILIEFDSYLPKQGVDTDYPTFEALYKGYAAAFESEGRKRISAVMSHVYSHRYSEAVIAYDAQKFAPGSQLIVIIKNNCTRYIEGRHANITTIFDGWESSHNTTLSDLDRFVDAHDKLIGVEELSTGGLIDHDLVTEGNALIESASDAFQAWLENCIADIQRNIETYNFITAFNAIKEIGKTLDNISKAGINTDDFSTGVSVVEGELNAQCNTLVNRYEASFDVWSDGQPTLARVWEAFKPFVDGDLNAVYTAAWKLISNSVLACVEEEMQAYIAIDNKEKREATIGQPSESGLVDSIVSFVSDSIGVSNFEVSEIVTDSASAAPSLVKTTSKNLSSCVTRVNQIMVAVEGAESLLKGRVTEIYTAGISQIVINQSGSVTSNLSTLSMEHLIMQLSATFTPLLVLENLSGFAPLHECFENTISAILKFLNDKINAKFDDMEFPSNELKDFLDLFDFLKRLSSGFTIDKIDQFKGSFKEKYEQYILGIKDKISNIRSAITLTHESHKKAVGLFLPLLGSVLMLQKFENSGNAVRLGLVEDQLYLKLKSSLSMICDSLSAQVGQFRTALGTMNAHKLASSFKIVALYSPVIERLNNFVARLGGYEENDLELASLISINDTSLDVLSTDLSTKISEISSEVEAITLDEMQDSSPEKALTVFNQIRSKLNFLQSLSELREVLPSEVNFEDICNFGPCALALQRFVVKLFKIANQQLYNNKLPSTDERIWIEFQRAYLTLEQFINVFKDVSIFSDIKLKKKDLLMAREAKDELDDDPMFTALNAAIPSEEIPATSLVAVLKGSINLYLGQLYIELKAKYHIGDQITDNLLDLDATLLIDRLVALHVMRVNIADVAVQNIITASIQHILSSAVSWFGMDYMQNAIAALLLAEVTGAGQSILKERIFQGIAIATRKRATASKDFEYMLEHTKANDSADSLDASPKDISLSRKGALRELEKNFTDKFNSLLEEFVKKPEFKKNRDENIQELCRRLQEKVEFIPKVEINPELEVSWTDTLVSEFPEILAYIFTIWTFSKSDAYFDSSNVGDSQDYLMKPHAVQLFAIMCMLNMDQANPSHKLQNHFSEVLTGEGKSIVIAVVSIVFALLGFDVDAACYSEYLSRRDYQDFRGIFQLLGLDNYIRYGTFNSLTEKSLNRGGDIRLQTKEALGLSLTTNEQELLARQKAAAQTYLENRRHKVAVVDEADSMGNALFGLAYSPVYRHSSNEVTNFIDYIWAEKDNLNAKNLDAALDEVTKCALYKSLSEGEFAQAKDVLSYTVAHMLRDLRAFKREHGHNYLIQKGMVVYPENDTISAKRNMRYKTLFAAMCEDNISTQFVSTCKALLIPCGTFSYVDLLKQEKYLVTTGSTGTLKDSSTEEKQVLADEFDIKNKTYHPSSYDARDLIFDPSEDVKIAISDADFNGLLTETISRKLALNGAGEPTRPVLVFFASEAQILEFYNSTEFKAHRSRGNVQIMGSEIAANPLLRDQYIANAVRPGKITLALDIFGRGNDFNPEDARVNDAGGLDVRSTTFPATRAEQVQQMGRTCRQGKQGSYGLILRKHELIELYAEFGCTEEIIDEHVTNRTISDLYRKLNDWRNKRYQAKYMETKQILEGAPVNENPAEPEPADNSKLSLREDLHKPSTEYRNLLLTDASNDNKRKALEATIPEMRALGSKVALMIAFDSTGSMKNLIEALKSVLTQVVRGISTVLDKNGVSSSNFELMLTTYKDYDAYRAWQKGKMLLESTGFTLDTVKLIDFLTCIEATFGAGNGCEAGEAALWHAANIADGSATSSFQLCEDGRLTDIILIGDEPLGSTDQDTSRAKMGVEFFKKFKDTAAHGSAFQETYSFKAFYREAIGGPVPGSPYPGKYMHEANRLKVAGVAVHPLYVDNETFKCLARSVKKTFTDVQLATGGENPVALDLTDVAKGQLQLSKVIALTVFKRAASGNERLCGDMMEQFSEHVKLFSS